MLTPKMAKIANAKRGPCPWAVDEAPTGAEVQ